MKYLRWLHLVVAMVLLVSCATNGSTTPPFFTGTTPTSNLPTAVAGVTHTADATPALRAFLEALKGNDYVGMYALLDSASQAAITQDDFVQKYRETLNTMSAASVDYEVGTAGLSPASAQVPFKITYNSTLAGPIQRDMIANLNNEGGQWRLHWDESLILPELAGGNRLALDCKAPDRGDIFDNKGAPLVSTARAVAIGVDTGSVSFKVLPSLAYEIWKFTGMNPEVLTNKVIAAGPGWYIGAGTTSVEEGSELINSGYTGLVINPYTSRYYANSGAGSSVLGYAISISPDNIDAYKRKGYCGNERVGSSGVEKAEESLLAGKHGGSLYVVDPQGQLLSQLANVPAVESSDVYLTLDKNMEYYAQQAITGFTGAVVVIERDTGRVLAMASSPGFDSNLFDPQNVNNSYMLNDLLNDQDKPLLNRATQGQLPLGSVFKVITFSAALESGLYLPETTYDCQYDFTELVPFGAQVSHDWTWDHCQTRLREGKECNTTGSMPSGLLTLSEGLMRSCNPYFWHIGLDLFNNNRQNDIANMSRAFGLGSPTGIEIEEEPGQILDPTDPISAVNQAIGQGDVLVTPLQVARFMAAIGNGGTLYRPQIIQKIVGPDGTVVEQFSPQAMSQLPIQPERLKALQDAMVQVIRNRRGTANFRIGSITVPIAGKTGTAESSIPGSPHAWFAGYTFFDESNTGLKNIAIAVVLENAGEGSDYAAPVFRRMLEVYLTGTPQTLYWWESAFGVTKTPTPIGGIPTTTPKPNQ
jgi:penicillin-binding protein 2